MTKDELRAVTKEQILPAICRDVLNIDAQRLYDSLWYRGAGRELRIQVVRNEEACMRSRLPLSRLYKAQKELVSKEFMRVDQLNSDCARYEFMPLPVDEKLWHLYSSNL